MSLVFLVLVPSARQKVVKEGLRAVRHACLYPNCDTQQQGEDPGCIELLLRMGGPSFFGVNKLLLRAGGPSFIGVKTTTELQGTECKLTSCLFPISVSLSFLLLQAHLFVSRLVAHSSRGAADHMGVRLHRY